MRFRHPLLALLLAVSALGATAPPVTAESERAVEDTLLIGLPEGSPPIARRIANEHGARLVEEVEGTGIFVVSTETRWLAALRRSLAADPRVAFVETNHERRASAVPDDLFYPSAQAAYLETIRLPEAWDLATGSDDVVLAVVDSGVDLEHPDLEGRLLPGHDFVNDDDSPDDDFGHGTQIATIAAAATDNRTGMAGVAWRGKVLPVKVLDQEGRGNDADIAAGIVWAADHGADVINLSFGAPHPSFTLTQAVNHARTRDVVIVSAAGNGQTANPDFPAALDGVVSVSGTDRNGYFAWFSNFGPTVDVAAPGMEVLAGSPGAYQRMEGTSYAAPIVAGVAMLVRARFPGENADQVIERLRMGARDAGPLGIDDYYGFGLIDALGALGGPSPAPREEATDRLLHEPDNTPDRASPIGSGTSAVIAPEGDVDWFSYDVPSARWLTFSVVPPTSGGARRMDAVVELYGPGLRLMQRADRAPSGGREEITAGVGSGRYYLRVSNFGATAGPAPYQVSVTPAPDPEAGRFRFPSIEMRSLPGTAAAVAIGDLSGDGANDILVSTIGDSTVASELRLYRQSAGGFETPRSIPIGGSGEGMGLDLGDLDGDGDLDAALANTDGIKLHYQSGGGLGPAKFVSAPGFWQLRPTQVEIGDIDGDGRQDLVTATLVDGVHVLFNRGTAFEDAGVNSTFAPEIEVADLNGDGREDIVTWECIPDRCEDIAVYTAKAGGGFSRTTMVLNGGTQGFSLGVGDVTGDGRPDVVGANGNIVHIFPQQADGTFAGGGGWGLGDHHTHVPMTVEVGDVEGDGPDDIAVLYGGLGLVYVTEQDRPMWSGDLEGNHTFGPKALAFGDIDSDGLADLAVASQEHGLVTLRRSSQADPGPQSPGGDRVWVRDTTPADGSTGATPDVRPALRFGRPLRPTSVTAATVTLVDGATGSSLPAGVVYDPAANSVILEPRVPLTRGRPYLVRLAGVQDADGHMLPVSSCCLRFLVGEPSDRSNPRIHPAGVVLVVRSGRQPAVSGAPVVE